MQTVDDPARFSLRREWQAFWLAVGFLTRIPMPLRIDYSPQLMNQCSLYFPLVGLLLGALYAGLYSLFILVWTPLVAILLVLAVHLWLTGAFHEDGLADSVDALGGGADREQRLTIMKDSRIGTYGAVALVMALGLKWALLVSTDLIWLALLVSPCISRLTPLLLMRLLPYVTRTGESKVKPVAEGFSGRRLALATMGVMLVALISGTGFVSLIAVSLVALYWGWTLKRHLGGYTGDGLGASVVLTELVWLLGLAAPALWL
ncbi:MAG: adenosylcobinamide-GDP ribazoletransferase [Natronospirillum sp.]|uniref:adenosylcobinamide-GDP ribazoletransferase n=1 Tax=Natronospirillum sp. TaxID=2812955 RepID=UPI0025D22BA8|nr:adenosylcobinamide-GDP ribazoletransferase [Natronospirillum sp.]MCH8553191.1 adenosylcobinamide-GDP ribazoletransferase [Natronospirillum sp.]